MKEKFNRKCDRDYVGNFELLSETRRAVVRGFRITGTITRDRGRCWKNMFSNNGIAVEFNDSTIQKQAVARARARLNEDLRVRTIDKRKIIGARYVSEMSKIRGIVGRPKNRLNEKAIKSGAIQRNNAQARSHCEPVELWKRLMKTERPTKIFTSSRPLRPSRRSLSRSLFNVTFLIRAQYAHSSCIIVEGTVYPFCSTHRRSTICLASNAWRMTNGQNVRNYIA